ncbi:MAG: TatD family hydrolase [Neptuniibacter sp.]
MQLIDTHCHLDFSVFDTNREDILLRAKAVGVTNIVIPGVSSSGWDRLLEITRASSCLHAALGLHPCFMQHHKAEDLATLASLVATERLCAIGEIGLDLFIPEADIKKQLAFLRPQLELAKQYELPVVLHVRKAHDQMLKQLRQLKLLAGGVVHAFSGSEQQAEQYIALGYKLGIGGTLTYERAHKLHRIVRNNPLESFVLETDAPDIPLSGHRGEVNVPERIAEVAEVMANLKQERLERVAFVTTQNARQLFKMLD